jgi:chromosome segregation ATPase
MEKIKTEEKRNREAFQGKITDLERNKADLTVTLNETKIKLSTIETERDETRKALEAALIKLDLQGNFEAEEKVGSLESSLALANARIANLRLEVDDLRKTKDDNEARLEALADKIRRMKVLLTKAKSTAQEHEAELKALLAAQNGPQYKVFSIPLMVETSVGPNENWCFLYNEEKIDESTEKVGPHSIVRWVQESVVRDWLQQDATLVGVWPKSIQQIHNEMIVSSEAKLVKDKEELEAKVAEVTEAFHHYKARAQLALKRMGADDREEKRAFLEEGRQIKELTEVVAKLEAQIAQHSQQEYDMMRMKSNMETEVAKEKAKAQALEEEIEHLRDAMDAMESDMVQLQRKLDTMKDYIPRPVEVAIVTASNVSESTTVATANSDVNDNEMKSGVKPGDHDTGGRNHHDGWSDDDFDVDSDEGNSNDEPEGQAQNESKDHPPEPSPRVSTTEVPRVGYHMSHLLC